MRPWIAFLLLVGCKETVTVNLTFGDTTPLPPIGFRCRDSANKFLPARAANLRVFHVSMIVDYYALDGIPDCRPADMIKWCNDKTHDCHVITDDPNAPRICIDEDRTLGPGDDAVKAMADVLTALQGRLLTTDAPHEPLIVRAVATAQTCAELAGGAAYDVGKLVGCAISCPVQLDTVTSDVLLALPTLTDSCEAAVDACATGAFIKD